MGIYIYLVSCVHQFSLLSSFVYIRVCISVCVCLCLWGYNFLYPTVNLGLLTCVCSFLSGTFAFRSCGPWVWRRVHAHSASMRAPLLFSCLALTGLYLLSCYIHHLSYTVNYIPPKYLLKNKRHTMIIMPHILTLLSPRMHRGFCERCSLQLEICPMCRRRIEERQKVEEKLNSKEEVTWP